MPSNQGDDVDVDCPDYGATEQHEVPSIRLPMDLPRRWQRAQSSALIGRDSTGAAELLGEQSSRFPFLS